MPSAHASHHRIGALHSVTRLQAPADAVFHLPLSKVLLPASQKCRADFVCSCFLCRSLTVTRRRDFAHFFPATPPDGRRPPRCTSCAESRFFAYSGRRTSVSGGPTVLSPCSGALIQSRLAPSTDAKINPCALDRARKTALKAAPHTRSSAPGLIFAAPGRSGALPQSRLNTSATSNKPLLAKNAALTRSAPVFSLRRSYCSAPGVSDALILPSAASKSRRMRPPRRPYLF